MACGVWNGHCHVTLWELCRPSGRTTACLLDGYFERWLPCLAENVWIATLCVCNGETKTSRASCVCRRVRAEAASALREAAKRLAESEAELSQLRGDVNALQEELDNRPTAADQR